mgnify:CR=1 FL=1
MLRSLFLVLLLGYAHVATAAEDGSTPPPADGGTHQCERNKAEAQTS